jgi:hypothetical protein
LSYHFPPSVSAGALRWEKLARFAAERGYGLDVVALSPESLSARDDARLAELPAGLTLTGVPEPGLWSDAIERRASALRPKPAVAAGELDGGRAVVRARPASLPPEEIRWSLSRRGLLRAWWSWQGWARDRHWARAAAAKGAALVDPRTLAVITCGPPHMVHVAGSRLARRIGLPHVMDMRDPWSLPRRQPEELASPLNFALARRAERRAIRNADLVVANTDALRDALRARYPERSAHIITVMNGYDEEPVPVPSPSGVRFNVVYAGAIYLDRDPGGFLRAAGRVASRLGLTPEQFGIDFLGTGDTCGGRPLRTLAHEAGVSEFVTIHPRKPRQEALAFLAGSTMLLNLPQDSPYAIPSKVFEYLQFPCWILALAAPGTPTAEVLRGTGVDVVTPDDDPGIERVLTMRLEQFRQGERPGPVAGRHHLSRAVQAGSFFDALEQRLRERGAAS